LIAVTILTSSNEEDLQAVGINSSPAEMVTRLASLAKAQDLDGVVCSARETTSLKSLLGQGFKLVTPGIRLADDSTDDQKRIMTPIDAVQSGADYLVIGRPITQAENPLQKLKIINAQIETVL
jgi:orotidine-5'-phosphate decarboxylase